MSYIIKNTGPFVSIKLTEKGREQLAQGQLNFSFWGIGDSEINYDREAIVDANPSSITLSATSNQILPPDPNANQLFNKRIVIYGFTIWNSNSTTSTSNIAIGCKDTANTSSITIPFFNGILTPGQVINFPPSQAALLVCSPKGNPSGSFFGYTGITTGGTDVNIISWVRYE